MHIITTHGGLASMTIYDTVEEVAQLTRQQCIDWLVANDKDGCFTDEDSVEQGLIRVSLHVGRLLVWKGCYEIINDGKELPVAWMFEDGRWVGWMMRCVECGRPTPVTGRKTEEPAPVAGEPSNGGFATAQMVARFPTRDAVAATGRDELVQWLLDADPGAYDDEEAERMLGLTTHEEACEQVWYRLTGEGLEEDGPDSVTFDWAAITPTDDDDEQCTCGTWSEHFSGPSNVAHSDGCRLLFDSDEEWVKYVVPDEPEEISDVVAGALNAALAHIQTHFNTCGGFASHYFFDESEGSDSQVMMSILREYALRERTESVPVAGRRFAEVHKDDDPCAPTDTYLDEYFTLAVFGEANQHDDQCGEWVAALRSLVPGEEYQIPVHCGYMTIIRTV